MESGLLTLPLSSPPPHQAQRRADALQQALAVLGDKVRQQTAPNRDVQKEIADVTEVRVVAQQPGCCRQAAEQRVRLHSP